MNIDDVGVPLFQESSISNGCLVSVIPQFVVSNAGVPMGSQSRSAVRNESLHLCISGILFSTCCWSPCREIQNKHEWNSKCAHNALVHATYLTHWGIVIALYLAVRGIGCWVAKVPEVAKKKFKHLWFWDLDMTEVCQVMEVPANHAVTDKLALKRMVTWGFPQLKEPLDLWPSRANRESSNHRCAWVVRTCTWIWAIIPGCSLTRKCVAN